MKNPTKQAGISVANLTLSQCRRNVKNISKFQQKQELGTENIQFSLAWAVVWSNIVPIKAPPKLFKNFWRTASHYWHPLTAQVTYWPCSRPSEEHFKVSDRDKNLFQKNIQLWSEERIYLGTYTKSPKVIRYLVGHVVKQRLKGLPTEATTVALLQQENSSFSKLLFQQRSITLGVWCTWTHPGIRRFVSR